MDQESKKLSPEQLKTLDNDYSIKFKKRQWIVIYNILVSLQYKLGDARIVNEICDQIQRFADLDIKQPDDTKTESNGVITN